MFVQMTQVYSFIIVSTLFLDLMALQIGGIHQIIRQGQGGSFLLNTTELETHLQKLDRELCVRHKTPEGVSCSNLLVLENTFYSF